MSGNHQLPIGWEWATIADLSMPGNSWNPRDSKGETFKYIDIEAIDNERQCIIAPKELAPADAPSRARVGVKSGDVLFSLVRPYLKNIAVVPEELDGQVASTAFLNVRPGNGIDSSFVFNYFLQDSFINAIPTYGNSPPAARDDEFVRAKIPLAPSGEQKRISSKVDELLSDLDAGIEALERVRANLKRYRAAVLKAAFEGQFSGNSGVGRSNAWKPQAIESAIAELDQGWSPKCSNEASASPEVWSVIKTTAVQPLQFLAIENKVLPLSLRPRAHLELMRGDLLVTRAGPRTRVGITCLVRDTRPRLLLCDKVYRIRTKPAIASPEFLEIVLNAPGSLDALDELKTGISDSGVNLTQKRFTELQVPLPSIGEQEQTLAEVQRHISIIERVEAVVSNRLLFTNRLRQAVLKRAFEGKLVSQDPNDEPASVLLERIRKERAADSAQRVPKRRKSPA